MSTGYDIPAAPARETIIVLNSRFIASAAPAPTVEAARSFIASIRAEMPDANHHVHAFVVGHGAATTLGATDDGEPSGTAGRPTLAVVQGAGIGDIVVVVTRYFGGTLLGTGGLVRAYSDAARAVLAILPRERKIERRDLLLTIPYAAYETTRRLLAAHAADILGEAFAADVQIEARLPLVNVDALTTALAEATAGQAVVV